jgi:hypothetical protein
MRLSENLLFALVHHPTWRQKYTNVLVAGGNILKAFMRGECFSYPRFGSPQLTFDGREQAEPQAQCCFVLGENHIEKTSSVHNEPTAVAHTKTMGLEVVPMESAVDIAAAAAAATADNAPLNEHPENEEKAHQQEERDPADNEQPNEQERHQVRVVDNTISNARYPIPQPLAKLLKVACMDDVLEEVVQVKVQVETPLEALTSLVENACESLDSLYFATLPTIRSSEQWQHRLCLRVAASPQNGTLTITDLGMGT